MATSESYDFSMKRDTLINSALRLLGVVKYGTNPPTAMVTAGAECLNIMLKSFQAEGIGLWLLKTVTVFLQTDTESYALGASGTYATETYVSTTLASAAILGATTIVVTSVTGITSAYYIGIELDDGTLQWTTVSGAPSGTTVTLAAALTDTAAAGNTIFCFQKKVQRPLEIMEARLRDEDGKETPINIVSRSVYMNMSDKSTSGMPTIVYYDPQLTNGTLYVWPTTDSVDNVLRLTIKKPIQDFDAATDDCDFPIEWAEAIKFNLALRLAPELMDDIAEDRMKYILEMARESKRNAQGFDAELNTSIYFQPDLDSY